MLVEYHLLELDPVFTKANVIGKFYSKEEAEKWVNQARWKRTWHEHPVSTNETSIDSADLKNFYMGNFKPNLIETVHIDGIEMHWILIKFLRESLDFLANNPAAKGMRRIDWINKWQEENLTPENMKQWISNGD